MTTQEQRENIPAELDAEDEAIATLKLLAFSSLAKHNCSPNNRSLERNKQRDRKSSG